MNQQTRAPIDDPPPAYARVITRAYRRNLRPPIFFVTVLGSLWAFLVGVEYMRDLGSTGETTKLKLADLLLGALCFVVAGIELFGLTAAITMRLKLIKTYAFLSVANLALFLTIEILAIVFHFSMKNDYINQCEAANADDSGEIDEFGNIITSSDVVSSCQAYWSRYIFYDVAWIIGLTVLGVFTLSLASAWYHQAKNPQSSRVQAPSAAYRMDPYAGQDPPFVPPSYAPPPFSAGGYDGPPEYSGDYKAPAEKTGDLGSYDKNDSETTLRGVDLNDEADGQFDSRQRNEHVV